MEGVCSECGLSFAWSSLWDEVTRPPRWYVEARVGVVQFASTWARHVWPSSLWRALGMRMEMRVARLAAFAIIGILLCHLLLGGTELALEIHEFRQYIARWAGRGRPMPTLQTWIDPWNIVFPYGALLGPGGTRSALLIMLYPLLVGLLIPSLCFLFSDTLKFERVRLQHLVRITLLWLPTSVLGGALVLCTLTVYERVSAMPVSVGWMVPALAGVLFVMWPAMFWHRAFKTYLNMARPRLMTIVILGAALIIGLALLILIVLLSIDR